MQYDIDALSDFHCRLYDNDPIKIEKLESMSYIAYYQFISSMIRNSEKLKQENESTSNTA
jgi:hypothetical protein